MGLYSDAVLTYFRSLVTTVEIVLIRGRGWGRSN